MCPRPRERRNGAQLSRLSLLLGFVSTATLVTAFVSNVWIFTREPVKLPNVDVVTTVTFKIGFWRVCPQLKRAPNMTRPMPSPSCTLVKYTNWDDVRSSDLGMWTPLEFTPSFVSKMRWSMPFGGLAAILMILATLFALAGHFNSDHKTLVACWLYILAGLSMGGGLIIFGVVLNDAFWDRPRRDIYSSSGRVLLSAAEYTYRYGWSFMAASAAMVGAEVAAIIGVAAYLRRFASVEDMVRLVVPGLDRKLNESFSSGDYVVRRTLSEERATTSSVGGDASASRSAEALVAGDADGAEGPLLMRKKRQPGDGDFMVMAPDICSQQCCDEGQLVVVVTGGGPGAALMGGQPPHHHHHHHHPPQHFAQPVAPPVAPQRVFSELRASRTALVQAQMNTSSLLKKKSVTIGTFTTMEGPHGAAATLPRASASGGAGNYSSAV